MNAWAAVLVAGAASYLIRLAPLVLPARRHPGGLQLSRHAGPAVLAAMATVSLDAQLRAAAADLGAGATVATLAGVAAAAFAARRQAPLALAVAAGLATRIAIGACAPVFS